MDIRQVTETIAMIEEQNFDIRTITMGISLLDCIDLRRKFIKRLRPRQLI